jgi:hypothetical protein
MGNKRDKVHSDFSIWRRLAGGVDRGAMTAIGNPVLRVLNAVAAITLQDFIRHLVGLSSLCTTMARRLRWRLSQKRAAFCLTRKRDFYNDGSPLLAGDVLFRFGPRFGNLKELALVELRSLAESASKQGVCMRVSR